MTANLQRPDALRPTKLDDFVGQPDVVAHLRIVLEAAKERGELPDHLLLVGPPGLGKTTLAAIVASELGLPMSVTSGPAVARPADLIGVLNTGRPMVVFLDEVHRLDVKAEEVLYPALEDGMLDFMIGAGSQAHAVRLPLQPFVMVAATTQMGSLSAPLRDRFGYVARLQLYTDEDLASIVQRSAGLLNVEINESGALAIARRSRGTPRVANALLRRARDWAQVKKTGILDEENAVAALAAFGVDDLGLDQTGRDLLHALCTKFGGGPVGARSLASAIGEAENTVYDVYEPHLMRRGLLIRTPRGRVATAEAYTHLNLPVPAGLELHLITAELDTEEQSEETSSEN